MVDVSTRAWKGFDEEKFRQDLLASRLCMSSESYENMSVDDLQHIYDSTLSSLLDKHAPKRTTRRRYQPITPWFDSDCAAARRRTPALERRYRRTKITNDRLAWTVQVRRLHKLYAEKQNLFWESKVKDSRGNPKKLWKTLSSVLCRDRSKTSIPTHGEITADSFLRAFAAKVESVRSSTASAPYPEFIQDKCASSFDQFDEISSDEARTLVLRAAEKNCALDPVPTWIIKKFINDLAPFIAILINTSTRAGLFPSTQKCAMVTPIPKKPSLDPYDLSNYRPVSNLSFISKIMKRSIHSQMNKYLEDHNLLPTKQSAYRKFHSTETALLDILSDVLLYTLPADAGQVTLLGLLDQSSAFDVIDHCILIDRLRHTFGFSGKVLEWMTSYLTDRTQYVHFNGVSSNIIPLVCGVLQGSVLGPQFYILYTGGIISIVEQFGFIAHLYADDLQIYAHVSPSEASSLITRFSDCMDAVKRWMEVNRLCLNPAKTEIIWLGSSRNLQHCSSIPLLISGVLINHLQRSGILV